MLYLLINNDLTTINNTITELSNNSREKVGDIKYSVKSSLSGYVLCNGATITSNQYPDLVNALPKQTRLNGQYESLSSYALYSNYQVYDNTLYDGSNYWTVGYKKSDKTFYILYSSTLAKLVKSPSTKVLKTVSGTNYQAINFANSYQRSLYIIGLHSDFNDYILYSSSLTGTYNERQNHSIMTEDNLATVHTVTPHCLMGYWYKTNNSVINILNVNTGAYNTHNIDEFTSSLAKVYLPTGGGEIYIQALNQSSSSNRTGTSWIASETSNSNIAFNSMGEVQVGLGTISTNTFGGFYIGADNYLYEVNSIYRTGRKLHFQHSSDSPIIDAFYSDSTYYAVVNISGTGTLYYTLSATQNFTQQTAQLGSYNTSSHYITDNTSIINNRHYIGWLEDKSILPMISSPSTNTQPVNAFIKTTN